MTAGTYAYGESRARLRPEPAPAAACPAPPPRSCRFRDALHPAPTGVHAERLGWYLSDGANPMPFRIAEWTCADCRAESYEYGVLGGAFRIRRTVRRAGRAIVVHETPAVRRTVAAQWWRDLITGRAV